MTIESHLKRALEGIDAAISHPDSLVMERNALNLVEGNICSILEAIKQRVGSPGAEPARVEGDPHF
jgi:hypothetical protein